MKLAVYEGHRVGVVDGDRIFDVTDAVEGAGPGWPPMLRVNGQSKRDANTRYIEIKPRAALCSATNIRRFLRPVLWSCSQGSLVE